MSRRPNSVSLFNADPAFSDEGTNLLAAMVFNPMGEIMTVPFRDSGEPSLPYRVLSDQEGSIPVSGLEVTLVRTGSRDPTRRTSQWWRMPSETASHFAGYLPVSEDVRDAYERGAVIAGGMGVISSTRSTSNAVLSGTATAFTTIVRVDPTTLTGPTIQRLLKAAGSGAVVNVPIGSQAVWLSDEFFTPPIDYWMTDAVEPDGAILSRQRGVNDLLDGGINATPLVVLDTNNSSQAGLLPPWAKGRCVMEVTWCGDQDPIPTGRDGNYNIVLEVTRTSTDLLTGLALPATTSYGICGGWSQFGLGGRMSFAVNGSVESDDLAPITRIVVKLNSAHILVDWKAVTSVINMTFTWPNLLDTGEVQPMSIMIVRGLTPEQSMTIQTSDIYSVVPTTPTALIAPATWAVASPHDTMRLSAFLSRQKDEYSQARVAENIMKAAGQLNPIVVDRLHQTQFMNADWRSWMKVAKNALGTGMQVGGALASVLGQPELGVPLSVLGTKVGNSTFFNASSSQDEYSEALKRVTPAAYYTNTDSGGPRGEESSEGERIMYFNASDTLLVRFEEGTRIESTWFGRVLAVLEENICHDDAVSLTNLLLRYVRAADRAENDPSFSRMSAVFGSGKLSLPWPMTTDNVDASFLRQGMSTVTNEWLTRLPSECISDCRTSSGRIVFARRVVEDQPALCSRLSEEYTVTLHDGANGVPLTYEDALTATPSQVTWLNADGADGGDEWESLEEDLAMIPVIQSEGPSESNRSDKLSSLSIEGYFNRLRSSNPSLAAGLRVRAPGLVGNKKKTAGVFWEKNYGTLLPTQKKVAAGNNIYIVDQTTNYAGWLKSVRGASNGAPHILTTGFGIGRYVSVSQTAESMASSVIVSMLPLDKHSYRDVLYNVQGTQLRLRMDTLYQSDFAAESAVLRDPVLLAANEAWGGVYITSCNPNVSAGTSMAGAVIAACYGISPDILVEASADAEGGMVPVGAGPAKVKAAIQLSLRIAICVRADAEAALQRAAQANNIGAGYVANSASYVIPPGILLMAGGQPFSIIANLSVFSLTAVTDLAQAEEELLAKEEARQASKDALGGRTPLEIEKDSTVPIAEVIDEIRGLLAEAQGITNPGKNISDLITGLERAIEAYNSNPKGKIGKSRVNNWRGVLGQVPKTTSYKSPAVAAVAARAKSAAAAKRAFVFDA